ncbi:MAG: YodC family protein [Pseudorhodoplanes sp.]
MHFKPGDTVSLRSGGPLMTIAMVDGHAAFCEWFSDDQQPQSRSFVLTSLKHNDQRQPDSPQP